MTVADEFGITKENAPGFTAFPVTDDTLYRQKDQELRPMVVAEEDGVLCGYCSLRIRENGECELDHLAVLPRYRHRGIGRQLLEHACTAAKRLGCRAMIIGIVEENTALRRWYEQSGAVHTGSRKFDFFPFTCGYLKREL